MSRMAAQDRSADFVITPSAPPGARALLLGHAPEMIAPELLTRASPTIIVAGNPCDEIMEIAERRPDVAYLIVAKLGLQGIDDPRIDDVVFEPVSRLELELRAARAFARKRIPLPGIDATPVLTDGGLAYGCTEVPLSLLESQIVAALLAAGGAVVPRGGLARAAGAVSDASSRTVDTHIYRLRRKLAPFESIRIETVRQRGFRLRIESAL